MSEDKVFLDTNVIVYAFDNSAGDKHVIAKQIISDLWKSKKGIISTQVLQELFVIITAKIQNPIDVDKASAIINDFSTWDVIVNDTDSIDNAIKLHKKYGYSFWDSLIIDSAISGGAKLLLSEDLSHKQVINSLEISNPFLN